MSLTVTVQKGHDFSSGNVTRAALNAGATPTIAVTGSVTSTEIGDNSITASELANDAVTTSHIEDLAIKEAKLADDAVAISKIKALTKVGNVIIGGTGGNPEELDVAGSNKLLIGNGTTLLSLPVNSSSSDIVFTQSADGIALTVSNDKVTVDKIAHQTTPGVLAYGASGVPEAVTTANAGKILVTQGSSVPAYKYLNYSVQLSATLPAADTQVTGSHPLMAVPTNVKLYIECIKSSGTSKGYAAGERVFSWENSAPESTVWADDTSVGYSSNVVISGWDKGAASTHSLFPASEWKLMALVSE